MVFGDGEDEEHDDDDVGVIEQDFFEGELVFTDGTVLFFDICMAKY